MKTQKQQMKLRSQQMRHKILCFLCILLLSNCSSMKGSLKSPQDILNRQDLKSEQISSAWVISGDEQLRSLLAKALGNNWDIQQAKAKIVEAEALRKEAHSDLWPILNSSAKYDLSGTKNKGGSKELSTAFSTSADLSYTLDIWGKVRDNIHASDYALEAQRSEQEAAYQTLAVNVITTYVDLQSAMARLGLSRENLENNQHIQVISDARFSAGVINRSDADRIRIDNLNLEMQIAELKLDIEKLKNALVVLTGQSILSDIAATKFHHLKPLEPIESETLKRRPDIHGALANLRAAGARTDAAEKALFPDISVTASGAINDKILGKLFDAQSYTWGLGASIAQTLFDAMKRGDRIDAAIAQEAQAIATYEQTVLRAVQNCADILAEDSILLKRQSLLSDQAEMEQKVFDREQARWRAGAAPLAEVLRDKNNLNQSHQQELELLARRYILYALWLQASAMQPQQIITE